MEVSLLTPVCAVCLCMRVISNQCTGKKLHFLSDLSKLDTLLHKTHSKGLLVLWYQGSKFVCNIKCNNTSNMAQSPIQPKKQGNKENSGV